MIFVRPSVFFFHLVTRLLPEARARDISAIRILSRENVSAPSLSLCILLHLKYLVPIVNPVTSLTRVPIASKDSDGHHPTILSTSDSDLLSTPVAPYIPRPD
jgi:hypothetical protein